MRTALRRLAPLAAVGSLLTAVAVLTSMSTVGIHRLPLHTRVSSPTPARDHVATTATTAVFGVSRGENGRFEVPAWLGPVLGAILGALMLCLVAFLVWRMLAGAPAIRAAGLATKAGLHLRTRHDPVLDAVDEGIAELVRDDGDARFAVIICWVRLEEAAAEAGTERAPGDAPADLVRRLLEAHQVSPHVLDTLANLYRAARYSAGKVPPSMRDEARRAFIRLRDELTGSMPVASARQADSTPQLRSAIPVRPEAERT